MSVIVQDFWFASGGPPGSRSRHLESVSRDVLSRLNSWLAPIIHEFVSTDLSQYAKMPSVQGKLELRINQDTNHEGHFSDEQYFDKSRQCGTRRKGRGGARWPARTG